MEKLTIQISHAFRVCALLAAGCLAAVRADAANPFVHQLFTSHMVLQRDAQDPVWGWTTAGNTVTVTVKDQNDTAVQIQMATADANGRWATTVGPFGLVTNNAAYSVVISASGQTTVTLTDVLIGDVFLCSGQSNMDFTLNGLASLYAISDLFATDIADSTNYPAIRNFNVPGVYSITPAEILNGGSWTAAATNTTGDFSATGYFAAREIYKQQGIPVGIIRSSVGGTKIKCWVRSEFASGISDFTQELYDQPALTSPNGTVCSLYNGMIAPLAPFRIRAAMWYQGESDEGTPEQYRRMLPGLMESYRTNFNQTDLPFIVIQLPLYKTLAGSAVENSGWPGIREAELNSVLMDSSSRLVTILDLGVADNIHPPNKQDVGLRASWAAANLVYGQDVVNQGPVFTGSSVSGTNVVCTFSHVGAGLMVGLKPTGMVGTHANYPLPMEPVQPVTGGTLSGFAVAGANKVFYYADAVISGSNTVTVSSPGVPTPVAVRYGWASNPNPACNLYNQVTNSSGTVVDGLPASPFRNDPDYKLNVNNGSGTGLYALNGIAAVTASTLTGKTFDHWSGDTNLIADASSASTTVTVSQPYVSVLANYQITGAPAGLSATTLLGEVSLSWNAMSDVHYNIKRSRDISGPYTTLATLYNTTNYTDVGANNGTYYYVVSAANALGEGPDSSPLTVVTTGSSFVVGSTGWTASASVNSSAAGLSIDGDMSTRWSTVGAQVPGQWYQVDMKASHTVYKLIMDTGIYTGDYPRGYEVYLSSDGVNWGSPVASGAGSSAVTTVYFTPQSARYIRIVQTGSTTGNYWGFCELTVYEEGPASVPVAPSGLTATALSTSQINLSWTDNATNESAFVIERKAGSESAFTRIAAVNADVTAYQDFGLSAGTQYSYRISATNVLGSSAYATGGTNTWLSDGGLTNLATGGAATAGHENPPSQTAAQAFDGLSATKWFNANQGSSDWLQYQFGSPALASYYRLISANDMPQRDPMNWQLLGSGNGTDWTVLDTRSNQVFAARYQVNSYSFSNATAYAYYRLNILSNAGGSSYGIQLAELQLFNGADIPAPPLAPSGLTARAVSSSQIDLSWTDNSHNETGFAIERKTGSGAYSVIATVGANVTVYQNFSLSVGVQYDYRIQATNSVGASAYSAESHAATWPNSGGLTNLATGGTATANLENLPNETAAKAFDGLINTKWFDGNKGTSGWLQYQLSSPATVAYYRLISANDSPNRDPKNWQMLGSDNGTDWTVLDTRSNQVFAARYQTNSYSFNNATAYTYYRLNILSNTSSTGLQLAELQLFADGTASFAPSAPAELNALPGSGQILLNWYPVFNAQYYNVKRSLTSGGPYTTVSSPSTNSYTDTGLIDGAKYYYVVSAVNADGEGLNSAQVSVISGVLDPAAALLHYAFDGDFSDSSYSNNGTASGNAAITTDLSNIATGSGALLLDGADTSYVALTRAISFSASDPWSVSFWARRSALDDKGMVTGCRTNTADFIWLNNSFTGLRFRSSVGATFDFTAPKDQTLHHYALVASGSGSMSLYIDGVLSTNRTVTDSSFTMDTVGKAYSSAGYSLNGVIDDFRIYSRAVDSNTVAAMFAEKLSDEPLHYAFDGDFTDSGSWNNDGTGSGNAVISTKSYDAVVGSGALSLDGADSSYVAPSNAIVFSTSGQWSVAFWARRNALDDKGMVMGCRTNTADFIWMNSSFSGLRFRSSTGAGVDFTTPKDLSMHHYALVAVGNGSLNLYVDGVFVTNRSAGNTSFRIDTVGQAYPTTSHYAFNGILDDVRVYSRAVDAGAVAALFAQGTVTDPPSAVVAHVHVFLQGGQSNSDGRADPTELPTSPVNLQGHQDDVDFYYNYALSTLYPATSSGTQFGPEITCGRHLVDLMQPDASNRVAIIKYAAGGTSLYSDWAAGGNATTNGDGLQYINFQSRVTSGLASLAVAYPNADITIEGMIWMQGESDVPTASAAYFANLTNFIADVRLTYNLPNLPFIIGRLSSGQTGAGSTNLLAVVRQAQADVAAQDPWSGLVDTDNFPLKTDNLHFNAAGQQLLGNAFAEQLLYLNGLQEAFAQQTLTAADAEPGADADGDGVSNWNEYLSGTNPADRNSVLAMQNSGVDADTYVVRWSSVAGRTYTLEQCTNLVSGFSTVVSGLAATPPVNAYTDSVPVGASQQFYRVKAIRP